MTRRALRIGAWRAAPMRVIDGGARFGAEAHWDVYGDQLELYAFEPDVDECRRTIAEAARGAAKIRFACEPIALAGSKGRSTLHVARLPDSSSLLPNNSALLRRFAMAESLEHVGTTIVETTDLDSFTASRGLSYVDFVKLDVEGVELDVLRGARRALEESVLGLSVEVWFQEDHIGRPLFSDIDTHLRGLGFVLFDLRQLSRWQRRTLADEGHQSGLGTGQLMYGNALYLRDVPALLAAGDGPRLPGNALLKLASLAELFCYPDFAIEVLEAGQTHAVLSHEEATPLVVDLRTQAPSAGVGWRAVTRKAVRSSIPPRMRRRLMRVVSSIIAE
jgi:FkbM family methyltransferase